MEPGSSAPDKMTQGDKHRCLLGSVLVRSPKEQWKFSNINSSLLEL